MAFFVVLVVFNFTFLRIHTWIHCIYIIYTLLPLCVLFLRQDLTIQPWLFKNLVCTPGCPWAHRVPGIKDMDHCARLLWSSCLSCLSIENIFLCHHAQYCCVHVWVHLCVCLCYDWIYDLIYAKYVYIFQLLINPNLVISLTLELSSDL